jgi:hypothetical protein
MLSWLRSILVPRPPSPAGPPKLVRAVGRDETPLNQDQVERDGDAWRIRADEPGHVGLFDVALPNPDQCLLTYRLNLKTEDVARGVYLEMWCRVVGRGEFFSKGVLRKVRGTTDWSSFEVPFLLRAGQRADLLKLGLTFEGPGTAWVRDIQVFQTPLEA